MLYGANASVSTFIVNNILPCVAGNIVGGGLLIGGTHTHAWFGSNGTPWRRLCVCVNLQILMYPAEPS